MSEDRYPRRVFIQVWDANPCRGRQRKVWCRLVNDIFGTDKKECMEDMEKGDSSLKAFLSFKYGEREK